MSNTISYNINWTSNSSNVFPEMGQQIEQVNGGIKRMTSMFGGCWRQLMTVNQALEGIRNLEPV